ncbi:MAG: hypothetical protein D6681_09115 [Calditrichaeota bacterium]|nr:MAG: hypothetical protein D6681_09115 [Calditrichota bacterium]
MTAAEVTELLERNWEQLPPGLGSQWEDFYREFCRLVKALPSPATRRDVETAADGLFDLLNRYHYTRGLLRGWRSGFTERLPGNTLTDKEQVRQVCNRLRTLAQQAPGGTSPGAPPSGQTGSPPNAPSGSRESEK